MVRLKVLASKRKRWFWVMIYVLYVVFILLSTTALFAEQILNTRTSGIYTYSLTFNTDGRIEHYTVDLANDTKQGIILLTYNADTHHLDVISTNIQEITIDCRSIAEEKTQEILEVDYEGNENLYKKYFIDKDKFSVSVDADQPIDLIFVDVPYPSVVYVDCNPLDEGIGLDYIYVDGKVDEDYYNTMDHYDVEVEIFEKGR